MSGSLVVSLHDVSPHTQVACERIVADLNAIGVRKTSLLIVPNHHRRGHLLENARFCDWVKDLVLSGHEPVIHGYYHRRERKTQETAVSKLTTRVYTADEGEFFDIDYSEAKTLIGKAQAEFASLNLAPIGFIAPAWLLSTDGERAVRDSDVRYTTRLGTVLDVQTGAISKSQSLVWSVRSAWRRVTSLAWNATLFRLLGNQSLMRISIHPVDIEYPAVWRQILRLTATAADSRECLTYAEWVSLAPRYTAKS